MPLWPDNRFHLIFCDVGQGDATLIKFNNLEALIDGGPSGQKIIDCLSKNLPFWDRKIELVILTHPESDHLTGLIDVLERYNIDQIVVNSVIKDSAVFWQFYQTVLDKKAPIYSPKTGDEMKLGPINFLVLWPKEKVGDRAVWTTGKAQELLAEAKIADPQVLGSIAPGDQINKSSIVIRVSYGSFGGLLTGDIDSETEKQIKFPAVNILKIPHHGSHYSSSEQLLKESAPQLTVISVGKNQFGHPTTEVLDRLKDLSIETLRTDQNGTIEIISDGQSWQVKKERR